MHAYTQCENISEEEIVFSHVPSWGGGVSRELRSEVSGTEPGVVAEVMSDKMRGTQRYHYTPQVPCVYFQNATF